MKLTTLLLHNCVTRHIHWIVDLPKLICKDECERKDKNEKYATSEDQDGMDIWGGCEKRGS